MSACDQEPQRADSRSRPQGTSRQNLTLTPSSLSLPQQSRARPAVAVGVAIAVVLTAGVRVTVGDMRGFMSNKSIRHSG